MLAARWNHRHSTDVDCFMKEDLFRSVYELKASNMREMLQELEDDGELTFGELNSRMLVIEFPDLGSMSLISGTNLVRIQDTLECEEATRVRLESSAEILAKKLAFRVVDGRWMQRDFFDLVIASKCDPIAYSLAMDVLTEEERSSVANILRLRLTCSTLELGEIQNPFHADVADQTWELAAELFEGKEIELPPVPKTN